MSNGNQCGLPQDNILPGDFLVNFGFDLKTTLVADMVGTLVHPIAFLFGTGATGNANFVEAALLGLLPGSSKYIGQIKARANYDELTQNIYYSSLKYEKKILWLIPSQKTISSKSINQPAGMKPYEHYGGGFFQIYDTSQASEFGNTQYYDLSVKQTFNFIPTPSALDIGNYMLPDLLKEDYQRSYAPGLPMLPFKQSPFDSFLTEINAFTHQSENYRHISFNSRNGSWLAQELEGNNGVVTDCSFVCATDEQATGNALICQTEVYQTSFNADSYQWQVIEGSDLVTLQVINNKKISLTRGANKDGLVVLRLTMSSTNCGDVTFTKRIWVGKPKAGIKLGNRGDDITAKVVPISNNQEITWQHIDNVVWVASAPTVPGMEEGNFNEYGFSATATGRKGKLWGVDIFVTISNACGSVTVNTGMYGGMVHPDDADPIVRIVNTPKS